MMRLFLVSSPWLFAVGRMLVSVILDKHEFSTKILNLLS